MKISRKRIVRVMVAAAIVAAVIWISGVRLLLFPGESMAPAVRPGDYLVGVGLWHHRTPQRFDLVIYEVPASSKWAERKIPWMKRVVGLPGERVRFSGGQLMIGGQVVEAAFLHRDPKARPMGDFEVTLKSDEYFMLGDNLDHSFDDSRSMGPIRRSLLKGFVLFVIHRS